MECLIDSVEYDDKRTDDESRFEQGEGDSEQFVEPAELNRFGDRFDGLADDVQHEYDRNQNQYEGYDLQQGR